MMGRLIDRVWVWWHLHLHPHGEATRKVALRHRRERRALLRQVKKDLRELGIN